MNGLKPLLTFILTVIFIFSCNKDDEFLNSSPTQERIVYHADLSITEIALIKEVKDSLEASELNKQVLKAGTVLWEYAYIASSTKAEEINFRSDSTESKVVVPILNETTDEIENILVAIQGCDGDWKAKLINKYHYEFMEKITDYHTNRYFYLSLLKEVEKAQMFYEDPSNEPTTHALEIIIETSDGTTVTIDEDGNMTITGPGGAGCTDWTGTGVTIWNMDGNVI